jgi:HEAT repeat protein
MSSEGHLSRDTIRRIETHIAALGEYDQDKAYQAERRLIRFSSKAIGRLIEVAGSSDPQVRFRAVWVLGKSRDARAFETILRLTEDADASVAYDATLALAERGNLHALEPLRRLVGKTAMGAPETALLRLGYRV